jgi:methylenetetrahydrofolate--tRNA-(uracil-5-)-methyltransferase
LHPVRTSAAWWTVTLTGQEAAFFDAIAPIVEHATIDTHIAPARSRRDYGSWGGGINCPMDEEQYHTFGRA